MHPAFHRPGRPFVVLMLFAAMAAPSAAPAAPTLGFSESWTGTTTHGWSGSFDMTFTNPGTGGQLGAGDGYLLMTKAPPKGHFGTRNTGPEYAGNWQAAGITLLKVWLNDVNADEALSIHVSIGQFDNLWQYNQSFQPPNGAWGEFTVDLNDSANFTHIIPTNGKGFNFALQHVELLHIRHDLAPYMQTPDSIIADMGVDELLLTNASGGVGPGRLGAVHPVDLAPPYPNPSRGAVAMSIRSLDGGEVRFQVVDAMGRVVRSAALMVGAEAPGVWLWDGLDDRGRKVPPGAYRVRATGPSGGTSRPLVRVE